MNLLFITIAEIDDNSIKIGYITDVTITINFGSYDIENCV